jgi:hypothetical protein
LCWVLEPERLCEAITGKKWSDVNAAIDKSPGMKKRFKRHEQLARYANRAKQRMDKKKR